jgi:hypothetical protein
LFSNYSEQILLLFIRKLEPHAQNASRVLRYSLTGIFGCIQAVAQRGGDEPPERLPASSGEGETS